MTAVHTAPLTHATPDALERSIPPLLFLSHYPREHHQSPCASVYQVFIGDNRVTDLTGHIELTLDAATFWSDLSGHLDRRPTLLFNGFQSLLLPNSATALEEAVIRRLNVIVYWHETAWNLRFLAQRSLEAFEHLRQLLPALNVTHWVPTSQCMHAVATMFGCPFETFRIVYEVVDLERFTPRPTPKPDGQPLIVAGAGVPDARKGIDLFSVIAQAVMTRVARAVEFRWYAATPNRTVNRGVPYPDAIRWMGHRADFETELRDADIFLLTSRDDPSPLVVFEALACGHPAFCFASTGFSEMLPAELIAHDTQGMVERLIGMLSDFRPDYARYRAIAERYGRKQFIARAFGRADEAPCNIPDFHGPFLRPPEDDLEQAAIQRARILATAASLARQERALAFERRAAGASSAEAREIRNIANNAFRRIKSDLYRRDKRFPLPFLKARTGLSICVVGNSPAVLQSTAGKDIDRCDIVIRINNFQTKGFEPHVGSKTDYAVISPACAPSNELSRLHKKRIIVFGANMRSDWKRIKRRIDEGCGVKFLRENILSPELYIDRQRLLIGLDLTKDLWPSTGLTAIQWAIDKFGPGNTIFIHGFTLYEENETLLTRYFGAVTKPDGKHDFALERRRLQHMIEANEVRPFH
jgi:glycosyltransferase involved in cell wall biosynthesis